MKKMLEYAERSFLSSKKGRITGDATGRETLRIFTGL